MVAWVCITMLYLVHLFTCLPHFQAYCHQSRPSARAGTRFDRELRSYGLSSPTLRTNRSWRDCCGECCHGSSRTGVDRARLGIIYISAFLYILHIIALNNDHIISFLSININNYHSIIIWTVNTDALMVLKRHDAKLTPQFDYATLWLAVQFVCCALIGCFLVASFLLHVCHAVSSFMNTTNHNFRLIVIICLSLKCYKYSLILNNGG